ncbi:MAG TPA: hypothetical protein VE084_14375, partial [Burkholderiaceae bacterium]|nr:hypothetical protein [Burkholderiaceae bacterium]
KFRNESNEPITVAIDSPGGSLAVLETLIGLVTGPNQDGEECRMVAVVTREAYSAAAILLSKADYAVAMPHARILFHDVRYGGLDDVTPSSALSAAKALQTTNEKTALALASEMFGRWMWAYLDLRHKFDGDVKDFPKEAEEFAAVVGHCKLPQSELVHFDLAKFALAIFARLTRENEVLIKNAMANLQHWGLTIALARAVPKYKAEDGQSGMLDGALELFKSMVPDADAPFGGDSNAEDLTLFFTTLVGRVALRPRSSTKFNFERALSDFALLKTIEDPAHFKTATKLMLRHKHVFFDAATASGWDTYGQEEKAVVMDVAVPLVKAAWLLCLLVARELFSGEHTLLPREAMLLGLVDEVPNYSTIESVRKFMKDNENAEVK